MPIKVCRDCGHQVGSDRISGKYWCPNCKQIKEDFLLKYRIAVLGKNAGKKVGGFNFINCMAREWEKLGHEVHYFTIDDLFSVVQPYDIEECFHRKKKIPIRFIEYKCNPDFIYIEQIYDRLDRSEVKCPVIYQHREYTHFPDIEDPDILFASYPYRLNAFEFYHPYDYHKIQYRDLNLVAVDPSLILQDKEKILKGIYFISWALEFWQFAEANGLFAKMTIEDQAGFVDECYNNNYIKWIDATDRDQDYFIDMLSKIEAILIDSGYMNGFGRRMLEAMVSKTLCIIRIHHSAQKDFSKKLGLTEEMCYFVETPEDVGNIKYTEEERINKVEKAYEWVMKHHTYEVRAKETIEKFEEFMNGKKKMPYYMGYAKTRQLKLTDDGGLDFA